MTNPQTLNYYRQQSCFSTPDRLHHLYQDLPDNIPELCALVRGLYVHYRSDALPESRKDHLIEVNTRYVSRMLERIIALDKRDLVSPRPMDKRLIGCCRDASLLLVSMLRYLGIPARSRVGFATYIPPHKPFSSTDHVITEYWNADSQRWQWVDVEQDADLVERNQIDFDVYDIPRDKFMTGGQAWVMGRADNELWDTFGVNDFVKGRWFVATYLMYDVAALNTSEMLLWDFWGLMNGLDKLTVDDLNLLDNLARLTTANNIDFDILQTHYQNDKRLTVPETVKVYSPVSDSYDEILQCD